MGAQIHVLTTSWDDGHPLDLKIADLLAKYGLPGTFYVPRNPQRQRLAEGEIRELSQGFEIGAHTLSHRTLPSLSAAEVDMELEGSKAWVEELTGQACRIFAFPLGKFARRHLLALRRAGFGGCRTAELLSLAAPTEIDGLRILPTTLQAYPHAFAAYARNVFRRLALGNLIMLFRCTGSWTSSLQLILELWRRHGGVLHLWGHSYEIEETGGWPQLQEAFAMLHEARRHCELMPNGALCARPGISS